MQCKSTSNSIAVQWCAVRHGWKSY